MKKYVSFFTAVGVFLSLSLTVAAQQNSIQAENSLTGTLDWQIANENAAVNHEIEGYASQTSVNIGEIIRFHINVKSLQPDARLNIYRLGYYNGAGARLIRSTRIRLTRRDFPIPDWQTGLADCDWSSSPGASWTVPTDAVSGVYLVKLTLRENLSSYISFVVRDDARASDILFQRSVTTDQAYNNYPGQLNIDPNAPENGKSLYEFNSLGTLLPGTINRRQARKVSFNRPYGVLNNPATGYGVYQTAGSTLFSYDFQMIRWLEMNGYDVTYSTNVDTHTADATNGRLAAGRHKTLLSVGHDEYWSWEMRDNVEQARNRTSQPLNLGFFAGNSSYWQIRFEPSSADNTNQANVPNRTIVAYKELAKDDDVDASDPFFNDGVPENNHLITNKWRENQSNQDIISKPPEDELMGVMWSLLPTFCCSSNPAVISPNSPSWITQGTIGQQLDGLVGYEADRIYPENIYNDRALQIVAASPFIVNGNNLGDSHATFYTRNDNNARVFAAGTVQWSWGLDDFNADSAIGPVTRNPYRKQDVEIITTNVLGCLINGACN